MRRKKVLIVAMLDSVHTFRWLSQFKEAHIDFVIFPSKKYRAIHDETLKLLRSSDTAKFQLATFQKRRWLHGYLDFFFLILCSRMLKIDIRLWQLHRVFRRTSFDYIHALEIQGAGYLVDSLKRKYHFKTPFILTNWGSDIYHYENSVQHREKIISALNSATFYSAECNRDYLLAQKLGFNGIELPCIPNAGGFTIDNFSTLTRASLRTNIVAKAYGGDFGRGDITIQSIRKVFRQVSSYTAFLYSVTDDLIDEVELLVREFPGRVHYSSRRRPLSYSQMKELFSRSRVYMGASRSDGISTSFLEALNYGCYPIQTDTSCAEEWTAKGVIAAIIPQEVASMTRELLKALTDDNLVDSAQSRNFSIASKHLNFEHVRKIAQTFYA